MQTDAACQAFGDLVQSIGKISLPKENPSNRALVQALTLPRDEACLQGGGSAAVANQREMAGGGCESWAIKAGRGSGL